ncbi:MAG: patatin family protein, partial [Leptotrichiaceae bacterium]|nr:patatin family protein [Leptotrichiaceae bacterium]
MNEKKTGLVLEGGGLRGIFTAGVLDFFLEKNIEFDRCIGVSAGSCHACSYLSKQYKRAYNVSVDYLDDKRYCSIYSLIKTGDLFGADFLYREIPDVLNPIDNEAYLKNNTEFQAVITNCHTGKAEYPYINDMKKDVNYIRASSSLPFLSQMVRINGELYL